MTLNVSGWEMRILLEKARISRRFFRDKLQRSNPCTYDVIDENQRHGGLTYSQPFPLQFSCSPNRIPPHRIGLWRQDLSI